MGSIIELKAADGHSFGAYHAGAPEAPRAVVLCHDFGGLNKYMRRVCDQMAAYGFAVVAPNFFDRVERGLELTGRPADLQKGAATAAALTPAGILADIDAAAASLGVPKVGAVGYSWGATAAWHAAAHCSQIRAVVGYYGTGIADARQETPRCPTRLHFGEWDRAVPLTAIEAIRRAQPAAEIEIYSNAAHNFACEVSEAFSPDAAELARDHMLAFLRKHL